MINNLKLLPRFIIALSFIIKVSGTSLNNTCHPLCGASIFHAAGACQQNGRCLCWWGWTGENAVFIKDGQNKNRIMADYCTIPCTNTNNFPNPACLTVTSATNPTTTTAITTTANTPVSSTTVPSSYNNNNNRFYNSSCNNNSNRYFS